MRGLENKTEAKLRAKRLEGYIIRYDQIAKHRTRLLHQAEHLGDTTVAFVDEKIQAQVASSENSLCILYMDGHGNICQDVPLQPKPLLWVSLRMNSCTPVLLSINNVSIKTPISKYGNIITKIRTCQGSSVQILGECVVLCPPAPTFIESLHYLLIKIQIYAAAPPSPDLLLVGEATARPLTFSRGTIHKDRQFTRISDTYPLIFDSEVVGSLCIRLEMLLHDHTIEAIGHYVADCSNQNRLNPKEKRRLVDTQTQTVGYLNLALEEKRL